MFNSNSIQNSFRVKKCQDLCQLLFALCLHLEDFSPLPVAMKGNPTNHEIEIWAHLVKEWERVQTSASYCSLCPHQEDLPLLPVQEEDLREEWPQPEHRQHLCPDRSTNLSIPASFYHSSPTPEQGNFFFLWGGGIFSLSQCKKKMQKWHFWCSQ